MVNIISKPIRRLIETKQFQAGSPLAFDLPCQYDYNTIEVEVSGDLTVTTAPTTYHINAAARLLQRLNLFSDGSTNLIQITGQAAALANFEVGLARNITNPGASATGTVPVRAVYRLNLSTPDGERPNDSALHTGKQYMTKLTLQAQCASAVADLVSAAGSFSAAFGTINVSVWAVQTQYFDVNKYLEARLVKNESIIVETINATTSEKRVKLPTGMLLRGVKLLAYDDDGVPSDAVINNIQIKSGIDVPFNLPWDVTQDLNRADYRLTDSQVLAGIAFADLIPDGAGRASMAKLYNAINLTELDLVLDVTKPAGGDATVVAIPQFFIPQAAKVAANNAQ